LRGEYGEGEGPIPEASVLAIINRDRGCPEWYPYTPGFSPKEHLEELRMRQLEEDRRKHDLELARLQREAEERSQAVAEALRAATEATGRFTTKWGYIAVGIAILALLLVAAGYLFPDLGRQIGHAVAPGLGVTATPTTSSRP
jgi:ElaB/YqjD/DUF883 family membrane-anchored ribosome-binding protein